MPRDPTIWPSLKHLGRSGSWRRVHQWTRSHRLAPKLHWQDFWLGPSIPERLRVTSCVYNHLSVRLTPSLWRTYAGSKGRGGSKLHHDSGDVSVPPIFIKLYFYRIHFCQRNGTINLYRKDHHLYALQVLDPWKYMRASQNGTFNPYVDWVCSYSTRTYQQYPERGMGHSFANKGETE